MSDQPENPDLPVPPPGEPMDDATRARLRARVVAGLDEAGHRRPRRWLVPATAAAAVVVVAGVTAGVALSGDDDAPGEPSGPAGTAEVPPFDQASQAPDDTSDEPTPSVPPSDEASSVPSSAPVDPDENTVSDAEAACRPELEFVLKGADVVAMTTSETGNTVFFVKGDKWTACSTHGGRATVFGARALDAPDGKDAYAISSVYPRARTSTFASAGLRPEGSTGFGVGYTFPDGHRPLFVQVSDEEGRTWWSMDYTVTGGPINEGNQLDLDPIRVEVTTDGTTRDYTLDWALDTCRQANHGC